MRRHRSDAGGSACEEASEIQEKCRCESRRHRYKERMHCWRRMEYGCSGAQTSVGYWMLFDKPCSAGSTHFPALLSWTVDLQRVAVGCQQRRASASGSRPSVAPAGACSSSFAFLCHSVLCDVHMTCISMHKYYACLMHVPLFSSIASLQDRTDCADARVEEANLRRSSKLGEVTSAGGGWNLEERACVGREPARPPGRESQTTCSSFFSSSHSTHSTSYL